MLFKPIFTITSLSMFPFKNIVYTWIKVHKFCMKFTEKVWKLKLVLLELFAEKFTAFLAKLGAGIFIALISY